MVKEIQKRKKGESCSRHDLKSSTRKWLIDMTLHKPDFYSTAQAFKMSSLVHGSVIRPLWVNSHCSFSQALSKPYNAVVLSPGWEMGSRDKNNQAMAGTGQPKAKIPHHKRVWDWGCSGPRSRSNTSHSTKSRGKTEAVVCIRMNVQMSSGLLFP